MTISYSSYKLYSAKWILFSLAFRNEQENIQTEGSYSHFSGNELQIIVEDGWLVDEVVGMWARERKWANDDNNKSDDDDDDDDDEYIIIIIKYMRRHLIDIMITPL